jgi:hypothetical protein
MTRWLPLLVLVLSTGGCLAEDPIDDDTTVDLDGDVKADALEPVVKAERWNRDGVLEPEEYMQGLGWSVALDGDTAVAGAPDRGALVFQRRGDQWARPAPLRGTGAAGDEFGAAVAIQRDTAVVGAWGDDAAATDAGAIYVFTRTDETWRRTAKLTAPDAARGDRFGIAVAIDGDRIVVGADMVDAPNRPDAGAAYVFQRDGSRWRLEQKIVTDTPYASQFVGRSVAIDDPWIVLGAPGAFNDGFVYAFWRRPLLSRWLQKDELEIRDEGSRHFGNSVAVRGSTLLAGDDDDFGGGAAYVYTRVDGEWTDRVKLVASAPEHGDGFGRSVALADGVAVVGAWHEGVGGAAYVFTGSGDRWARRARLTTGNSYPDAKFGSSVAASGDLVLVGAYRDARPEGPGAAHAFLRF